MDITKDTKIAVLCGGISSEREISLRSGRNCYDALKRLGYKNSELADIQSAKDLFLLSEKNIEIAFLTTHGTYGEDGAIQGILEWLNIPYTGSSILGSAICMDKWLTKQIATNLGIINPKAFLLSKSNLNDNNLQDIWKDLSKNNNAVFLKPRDDGSSVNTFKIKDFNELLEKIKKINLNHSDYIIEEYIEGRELTSSIIEINNNLKVLPILELIPKGEFYDYHAKYTKGMTEFVLPANLKKETKEKIEEISTTIYASADCSSFGRVDFMLDKTEKPYLLEINSLPGMTDTSDLPAQAKCAGIEYDELVEIILKTARLHKIHLKILNTIK